MNIPDLRLLLLWGKCCLLKSFSAVVPVPLRCSPQLLLEVTGFISMWFLNLSSQRRNWERNISVDQAVASPFIKRGSHTQQCWCSGAWRSPTQPPMQSRVTKVTTEGRSGKASLLPSSSIGAYCGASSAHAGGRHPKSKSILQEGPWHESHRCLNSRREFYLEKQKVEKVLTKETNFQIDTLMHSDSELSESMRIWVLEVLP